MVKEIKIENFKSVQSLHLELGRLNVFIGANGSGKSNILEAIAFGSAAAEDKLGKEFFKNRGIRHVDPQYFYAGFDKSNNRKDSINLTFQREQGGPITFQSYCINPMIQKWITQVDVSLEDKKAVAAGSSDLWYANESQSVMYGKEYVYNGFLNFLIYAPENSCLRNFEAEGAIDPIGIEGEGLFKHLVDLFRENPATLEKINAHLRLLDWFEGFEIPNDLMFTERRIKIKDQFLTGGLQYIDQRSANEGFLYLLFYLTLFISDYTPKFFAIDNIDNAMNPKLGKELIKVLTKLAKTYQKQTILTTHNPSVLDGLDLNDDEQRLFVVYRNADGHTKVKRVFKKEMPEGIAPMPLSEMFLKGIIGG